MGVRRRNAAPEFLSLEIKREGAPPRAPDVRKSTQREYCVKPRCPDQVGTEVHLLPSSKGRGSPAPKLPIGINRLRRKSDRQRSQAKRTANPQEISPFAIRIPGGLVPRLEKKRKGLCTREKTMVRARQCMSQTHTQDQDEPREKRTVRVRGPARRSNLRECD